MDLSKIFEAIAQNADKIGMGAIAISLIVLLFFGMRWFARFLDKDQDKDRQLYEMTGQAIKTGENIVGATKQLENAAVGMQATAEKISAGQDATIESNKAQTVLFQTLSDTLITALSNSQSLLSQHLDTTKADIIDALNSRDLSMLRKGVLVISPSGKIVSCNKDALAILDIKSEELINSTLADRQNWFMFSDGTPVPPTEIPTVFALQTAMPSRQNLLGVQRSVDSPVRWLLIDAEPVVSIEDHRVTRVIVTFRDVGDFIIAKTATTEMPKLDLSS